MRVVEEFNGCKVRRQLHFSDYVDTGNSQASSACCTVHDRSNTSLRADRSEPNVDATCGSSETADTTSVKTSDGVVHALA